jgi:hypothetical protein
MRAALLSFLGLGELRKEWLLMLASIMLQVTRGSFISLAVMRVLHVERLRRHSSERSYKEGGGVVSITEGIGVMVEDFGKYLSSKLEVSGGD